MNHVLKAFSSALNFRFANFNLRTVSGPIQSIKGCQNNQFLGESHQKSIFQSEIADCSVVTQVLGQKTFSRVKFRHRSVDLERISRKRSSTIARRSISKQFHRSLFGSLQESTLRDSQNSGSSADNCLLHWARPKLFSFGYLDPKVCLEVAQGYSWSFLITTKRSTTCPEHWTRKHISFSADVFTRVSACVMINITLNLKVITF